MKNLNLLAVVILLSVLYLVFAQERIPHDMNASETPDCVGGNTLAGRMANYCPFRVAMAESELQNQIVTNTDGGIIVLAGSRLLKYDRDLNLLRKVELDVDINERLRTIRENDIRMSELLRFLWW
ncbi:MAG: hypothetical protein A2Y10_12285 [Planctomycetes bacterium GWF2_41_51]|nr:MAG: hypothetical protein A2Y10_12285 [Planctomycetes bacterium GWF2_41_51]HBG26958.1 hypothetical protein [Phycisphaerales bacterium]